LKISIVWPTLMIRRSGWWSCSHASARLGVGIDDEDRVACADLGLGVAAEGVRQAIADPTPLLVGIGREERDLARTGRHGVAIDGHARAVRAAVVELGEHRAEVLAEVLGHHGRLREEAGDSAHARDF
jgi:hypothetical protein